MERLRVILMALFMMPIIAMGADTGAVEQTAAVYQQSEELVADEPAPETPAADATPTPTQTPPPSVSAQIPVITTRPAPTPTASSVETATITKPAPEAISVAKILDILNKEIINLQIDINQLQQQNRRIRQEIAQVQYVEYGLIALVVFLTVLLLVRHNKKPEFKPADFEKTADDTQNEYDFMGSNEGIPAKLDLARAYIAMGDFVAARETLAEILQSNQEEYHLEAKTLLSKIN